MDAGRIVVAIGDTSLARVLALWLADALPGRTIVRSDSYHARSGDTVLVTPTDCEPPAAAELVARGSHPVVLVPVARAQEYERYHRAGASYIVMDIQNNSSLLRAIVNGFSKDGAAPEGATGQSAAREARAASSHAWSRKFSA